MININPHIFKMTGSCRKLINNDIGLKVVYISLITPEITAVIIALIIFDFFSKKSPPTHV